MSRVSASVKLSLIAAGCCFLSAGPASAGVISIGAASLSSDGSEISGGALTPVTVLAWNVNDPDENDADVIDDDIATPPTFDVNGVTFQNDQPAGVAIDFTGGGGSDTFTNNDASYDDGSGIEFLMRSVLVTADADPGSPGTGTVTVSGLTVGQRYRVQLTHQQDIGNAAARRMQVFFGNDASTDTTGLFNAGDGSSASPGGFITTVDFTADAASQLFTLQSVDGTSERAALNGVALFTIPEPASLALLGLSALCMMPRVRRG